MFKCHCLLSSVCHYRALGIPSNSNQKRMNKSQPMKVTRKGSQQNNLACLDWFKKRHGIHLFPPHSSSPYSAPPAPRRPKTGRWKERPERREEGEKKIQGSPAECVLGRQTAPYGMESWKQNLGFCFENKRMTMKFVWGLCDSSPRCLQCCSTMPLQYERFQKKQSNKTPQSRAHMPFDNADMSVMLPREQAGRRQTAAGTARRGRANFMDFHHSNQTEGPKRRKIIKTWKRKNKQTNNSFGFYGEVVGQKMGGGEDGGSDSSSLNFP